MRLELAGLNQALDYRRQAQILGLSRGLPAHGGGDSCSQPLVDTRGDGGEGDIQLAVGLGSPSA